MKRIFIIFTLLSTFNFQLSTLSAQTYVWKDGHVLVENPDSITFVKPDMGAQVYDSVDNGDHFDYLYTYPTIDHAGKPCVMSAVLYLKSDQRASKHIGKMAMYSHYTIMSSSEAPTAGELFNLQAIGLGKGMREAHQTV